MKAGYNTKKTSTILREASYSMTLNAAVAATFADILADLGNIPPGRVRTEPKPGTATVDDLLQINRQGALCELIDGTLVEKAIGWRESLIASLLCELLRQYLRAHNLGLVSGPHPANINAWDALVMAN